jgi:hypothetical protein
MEKDVVHEECFDAVVYKCAAHREKKGKCNSHTPNKGDVFGPLFMHKCTK